MLLQFEFNVFIMVYMRFILLFSIFFGLSVNAQDINSVFISMPDSLSPILTKVNRQDFSDFLSSGMKAVIKNKFDGKSEMLKLTDDYLLLKTTSVSSEEMKLLPLNDSVNVVCVVNTYSGPAEDSKVSFYTTDWKELPLSDFIKLPDYKDFYKSQNDSINSVSIDDFTMDMPVMKANLSSNDNDIVFKITSFEAMDKETAEKLKPYMADSLNYKWVNGTFVKE